MVTATKHPTTFEEVQAISFRRPLTAEDLQALPDDGNRYEIIEGQLIVSPSPNMRHQDISFELSGAIYTYLKETGSGKGYSAPADVHLSINDVVQPDILVVLKEHLEIVQQRGIFGAPNLVVEILSPSTMETDFLRKSRLYERYGVCEYWIVNPEREMVSVQTLDGDRFVLSGELGRDDTLRSSVLDGFALELSVLFPAQMDKAAQAAIEEPESTNDE